jgi:hypothetical protein
VSSKFIPSVAGATFLTALGVFAGIVLLLCYEGGRQLSGQFFGLIGERIFTFAFIILVTFGAAALMRGRKLN